MKTKEEMFAFVYQKLKENNSLKSPNPNHQFRNRFEHTKRVYKWANILLEEYPNCDIEAVLISAIFHDVGYSMGKENHAHNSALIFKDYATKNNFDNELIDKVYYIIDNHSNKSMLYEKDSSIELILLLEADLLDEEGALGIVWDLLSAGKRDIENYESGLNEIAIHSGHILTQDLMVTKKAIEIWNKKKQFVAEFINEYKKDLFLD